MKKLLSIFITIILLMTVVLAADLEVRKIDKGSTIIAEFDNPAVFDFVITNNGPSDSFEIYSLISVTMTPRSRFDLPTGAKTIEVTANPAPEFRKNSGFFNFEYQIKGQNVGIFKDNLLLKIVPLEEAIEISPHPIKPGDTTATITIHNKENTRIPEMKIEFDSIFFSGSQNVALAPLEEKNLSFQINKNADNILAGPYIAEIQISRGDVEIEKSSIIDYLETEGTSVKKEKSGFIIRKLKTTETNEGNTPVLSTIEIKKGIIARLFTSTSPEPLAITRDGFSAIYRWEETLGPNESQTVQTTTNYTFPFILLILIVLTGLMAKIYSQTALVVQKSISLVKTRGGEFALKVNLHIKAKKHVDNIQIIDTLPGMTKLYEKFGRAPDKIDHASRRLFWNIGRLNAGEARVYSYVIYSNLKVVGRFELPAATVVFSHDGKTQEVWSNRAFLNAQI